MTSPPNANRVLVVGAGIAGLTTAYWLLRAGYTVRVIERAATPRNDATMIDFYGPGFAVAEEMGIVDELDRVRPRIERWTYEDPSGMSLFSVPYDDVRRTLFAGRHLVLLRNDLRRTLLAQVVGDVPIRCGLGLADIRPYGPRVTATFSDGSSSMYDFVVVASGVHSATRKFWFNHTSTGEQYLGFDSASFSVTDGALCGRIGRDLRSLTGPGRHVTIYPCDGQRVCVRFTHERDTPLPDRTAGSVVRELRSAYRGFGGVVPDLLAAIEDADDVEYDAVTQVHLPRWSLGGVVLVGDACHCPSCIGGPGASLAMAGAFVLARELARSPGKPSVAFATYERRMRPVVARAQAMGERMARWIAPRSKLKMMARDFALRASVWPMGSMVMRRTIGAVERIS